MQLKVEESDATTVPLDCIAGLVDVLTDFVARLSRSKYLSSDVHIRAAVVEDLD